MAPHPTISYCCLATSPPHLTSPHHCLTKVVSGVLKRISKTAVMENVEV